MSWVCCIACTLLAEELGLVTEEVNHFNLQHWHVPMFNIMRTTKVLLTENLQNLEF